MGRVLLLHMPLAVPTVPNLAVELLAGVLAQSGIDADVFYGTCRLARTPAISSYIHSITGGVIFTPLYYSRETPEAVARRLIDCPKAVSELYGNFERFRAERQNAAAEWGVPRKTVGSEWPFGSDCDELLADVLTHMDAARLCLDRCLQDIPVGRYDVFAFSLMFDAQKLASLALARWLKEREPHAAVLFGGTACDGDMGYELLQRFPCIDAVAQGEADLTIAGAVRALRGERPLESTPGLLFRFGTTVAAAPPAPKLEQLDALPVPDYTSFLRQLSASDWRHDDPFILFEASRGCWWGEKHHCKFCGLRADGLAYRRKSPARVRTEIQELASRYPVHRALYSTDAILDYRALRDLMPTLPDLAARHRWKLFFELKSNLHKHEVALLAESGVTTVQPGIETFSDRILALMDKGNRGIRQVQFLKWLASYGIGILYNIILGTPGETPEDYDEMTCLLPYLWHLPPPASVNYLSLDKFSPYMRHPEAYGFRDVQADTVYGQLFPDPRVNLSRIAYKFEYRSGEMDNPQLRQAWGEFELALQAWREEHGFRQLLMRDSPSGLEIMERDHGESARVRLHGEAARLYRFCDAARSFRAIRSAFPLVPESVLRLRLALWTKRRWMYASASDEFLALAVEVDPPPSGVSARVAINEEPVQCSPQQLVSILTIGGEMQT